MGKLDNIIPGKPIPMFQTSVPEELSICAIPVKLSELTLNEKGNIQLLIQKTIEQLGSEHPVSKALTDYSSGDYSFRSFKRKKDGPYLGEGYFTPTLEETYDSIRTYGADFNHEGEPFDTSSGPFGYFFPGSANDIQGADISIMLVFRDHGYDATAHPTVRLDLLGVVEVNWLED